MNLQNGRKSMGSGLITFNQASRSKMYIERQNRTIRSSWVSKLLFDTREEVHETMPRSGYGFTIMSSHINLTEENHR